MIGARVLVGAVDAMTFISVLRLIAAWFATRALPAASVQLDLRHAGLHDLRLDGRAAVPGAAPLPVIVVLVLRFGGLRVASAVGFDFARTFNPATRLGAATGIVNMGGFIASLVTIFVVGVAPDLLAPSGQHDVRDFKIAFCFLYVVWAFGLLSLRRTRRLARADLRRQGTVIGPLPLAIARHWHDWRDQ